jgi:hypothetical protein
MFDNPVPSQGPPAPDGPGMAHWAYAVALGTALQIVIGPPGWHGVFWSVSWPLNAPIMNAPPGTIATRMSVDAAKCENPECDGCGLEVTISIEIQRPGQEDEEDLTFTLEQAIRMLDTIRRFTEQARASMN